MKTLQNDDLWRQRSKAVTCNNQATRSHPDTKQAPRLQARIKREFIKQEFHSELICRGPVGPGLTLANI